MPTTNSQEPRADLSARAETEDDRLRKRSFGGSCEKRLNPSRSSVPECKTPWPRPIPAKTLLLLGYYFRCRTITRDSKISPACHTCSRRFVFYITMPVRVQGEVDEFGAPTARLKSRSSRPRSRVSLRNLASSGPVPMIAKWPSTDRMARSRTSSFPLQRRKALGLANNQ